MDDVGILKKLQEQSPKASENNAELLPFSVDSIGYLSWHGHPANLLDDSSSKYISPNVANPWVLFDFKNTKIKLSGYYLKASPKVSPTSWILEGSNDNEQWIILDEQNSNYILKFVHSCNLSVSTNDYYRFFKFTSIAKNSAASYQLVLEQIDFYGNILYYYQDR